MRVDCERSRTRFVRAIGPVVTRLACDARIGRIVDGATTRRFSGPPPQPWNCLEEPLPHDEEVDLVTTWIGELARNTGATISYAAHDVQRVTWLDDAASAVRRSRTWSLTAATPLVHVGQLHIGQLHIGWSGAGSGHEQRAAIASELHSLQHARRTARPLDACASAAVLSPQAAAVLLHEAVGHAIEADPSAPSLLGRRIAAPCLSAADDPTLPGGPGTYDYDDDAVAAMGPTLVVREGIVVAELHSLASAQRAATLPTANARAASVWQEPIPRVSNLVCAAGIDPIEALVDRCGSGLYVHRLANGINDGARIQADVVLAERIVRGRLSGQLLSGGRVDESAAVALRIAEVGAAPSMSGNAMCGKAGQLLFNVGTLAPALRFTTLRFAA